MDLEEQEWKARQEKKELKQRMVGELLERCADAGFSYADVRGICVTVKSEARGRSLIRHHEENT